MIAVWIFANLVSEKRHFGVLFISLESIIFSHFRNICISHQSCILYVCILYVCILYVSRVFFFFLNIYLFNFGCVGLRYCMGFFSSCGEQRPLSGCSAQASHCGGSSCCRAQALELADFISCSSQALQDRLKNCGPRG